MSLRSGSEYAVHTLIWTGCGTMKIHRIKTWLNSFTELSMKNKKYGHGDTQKHRNMAFLEKAWTLNNLFISLFSTDDSLWPFRVGVVSFVFLQTNRFSCYLCLLPLYVSLPSCHSNCSLPKIQSTDHITLATSMQRTEWILKTPSSRQPDLSLLSLFLNCVWQMATGWGHQLWQLNIKWTWKI